VAKTVANAVLLLCKY